MYQNLHQIVDAARKVPFTRAEIGRAVDAVKARQSKGTDLLMGHPCFATDPNQIMEAANDGVLFLHSPEQLATGFLFVKSDAGRSFFGAQKAVYTSYIGTVLYEDSWFTSTIFKSWLIALTSISNIYRSQGYE